MNTPRLRLTVPLLSCTLLLTACPGNNLRVLDVPSNPAVLDGTWKGELTSAIQSGEATASEDRLYLLQAERIPPFSAPPAPRYRQDLVLLDLATGAERQRLPAKGTFALRYRPAEGSQPARLLALQGVPAADPSAPQTLALAELDPVTLTTLKQTALPGNNVDYHFSDDGRWLLSGPTQALDTRTLAPALLPEPIQEQLQPPQDTPTRFVHWVYEGRFLRVSTRDASAPNAPAGERLYAARTGTAFGGAARHPSPCPSISTAQLESPSDMVSLADGGTALAYQDGTVELRSREDALRRTVNLGGCQPVTLRADADVLSAANAGELITLRSGDGAELGRRTLNTLNGTIRPQLVAQGAALLIRPREEDAPLLTLARVDGAGWQVAQKTHTLRLETTATWVSKTAYTSAGTALLDGETLNFTATANSGGYELRPQVAPITPVTWQGELRRADGKVVARLSGLHDKQSPFQLVGLELQDPERDLAFWGDLTR